MNVFVALRILTALLFIVSGGEKLIGPYQNFLYVVQSYAILPPVFEEVTARLFPWIELFLGVFVLLGLWTKWALSGILITLVLFMGVVSQAILRKLPITECGCFGELASFPLPVILLFDLTVFLLTAFLVKELEKANNLSLDRYFAKA